MKLQTTPPFEAAFLCLGDWNGIASGDVRLRRGYFAKRKFRRALRRFCLWSVRLHGNSRVSALFASKQNDALNHLFSLRFRPQQRFRFWGPYSNLVRTPAPPAVSKRSAPVCLRFRRRGLPLASALWLCRSALRHLLGAVVRFWRGAARSR